MTVGITGATGFLGRYVVKHLSGKGHACRGWYREGSDRGGFEELGESVSWVKGALGEADAAGELVRDCDAVVHVALHRPGAGFRGAEGDVVDFVRQNVLGTLQLIEAARAAGVPRFIFISTCAVHEKILDDRPLDEAHPLWPMSHYGAHKAAIEKFVHCYGLGQGYDICALRPTGIYGLARPVAESRWFELVRAVVRGERVECTRGGKEVHVQDVARAVEVLLTAKNVAGEAYNCYDMYVSEYDVARLARELSGSSAEIGGERRQPKHQIQTGKLRQLGMEFGGDALLRETIAQLVAAVR